jgi:phosphonate ABC transporter permease subunit PhnE
MNNLPSSRTALWRLIYILLIVLGFGIYAYGWNTTDISLEEVQDPKRQSSVQRAMRELLSPDLFTRDRTIESFFVEFQIGCPEGELPAGRVETNGDAYVIFDPPCADSDEIVNVKGYNFPEKGIARIQLSQESGQTLPFKLADVSEEVGVETEVTEEAIFDIEKDGSFNVDVKVPKGRGLSGKAHQVEVRTAKPHGWPRLSDTSETVIDKMIETIFLALMATTLALPVSIAISFLAARNLMKDVMLPLGNVLVGFAVLPLGAVLGYFALGPLGQWGVDLGEKPIQGVIALAAAITAFAVFARFMGRLTFSGSLLHRVPSISTNLMLLVVLIFVVGILGGLGIWVSEQLFDVNEDIESHDRPDLPGDVGKVVNDVVDSSISVKNLGGFLDTLGTLVDLIVVALAATIGALWVASLGATLAAGPMRHVYTPLSNILGAALGFWCGLVLLAAMAYIGKQAILLRLLPPIIMAALGGQVAVLLYQHFIGGVKPKRDQTDADRIIYMILSLVGGALAFVLTAYMDDLIRAIVDGRPPSSQVYDLGFREIPRYVANPALLGAILAAIAGGLSGTQTPYPLGMTVYNTTRTVLNALRSIEPLIMGIVFVIWVGVGPFAGVLALTLHSIASLGKLYSEQVESIEEGPIEAIQATGANRLQTIIYAVVPQIVPPYIAFTMYRWDINVRMSTIIGFVGGGGIGFLLQQQINLLRYKQAGVAVLAIAIVVSILDYASAYIREKII